jgi:7,8-dihydropterin-6-yl-methyl-4-(beta-D-ribofuranosyl)aminobenzene 5'-phosphate synthase
VSVELVILVDDTTSSQTLRPEHGLAVLVAGAGRKVLFDTGATGETLLANAEAMGIDLADIDAVVISHGHYDHTGGLAAVVAAHERGLAIYAHPAAWRRRWSDRPGEPLKDISCPHGLESLSMSGGVLHPVEGPERLEAWLVLSGPVGGPKHGREVFVVRRDDDLVVDGFEDEQFCLVRGERGWSVLTGCCHRGLKNTLRTAKFLSHGEPIAAVIGGLHLRSTRRQQLGGVIDVLVEAGSPDVYPCHCSGKDATAFLAEKLPGKVHPLSAGNRVVL